MEFRKICKISKDVDFTHTLFTTNQQAEGIASYTKQTFFRKTIHKKFSKKTNFEKEYNSGNNMGNI